MIHKNTKTRQILEYIQDHPEGSTLSEITSVFDNQISSMSASSLLGYLRRKKAIETRGGPGRSARWYPIENITNPIYNIIAIDLLDELKSIHHSQKSDYLAKRLEEIFG